ncbi:MAG TPA: hydroxymethylglutaryl-CoA lyase [Candidatus Dormibacteraeota bacterium]|nr:hydroxymethylglutaryl-CoA lyase [Candidatus Dormibacteraeota bacterium]
MVLPPAVTIREVGPRDGFQMEPSFIPTERKVEVIDALARTGLREIEVTSFVHPKAVPQLADAEEVMARLHRVRGVRYSALVPNQRGAVRAIEAGVDGVNVVVSVTESHSLSNARMTPEAAMAQAGLIARLCEEARVEAGIGFATALGCPFEGIPPYRVLEGMVGRAVEDLGYVRVSIADTVGMANPRLVRKTMDRLLAQFSEVTFCLHLHNTRNMGLANLLAGLEVGVTWFDSSVAGLGGCPFAPGASGNVATEDVVNMLHEMGVETGVRLDAYLEVAAAVRDLVGHADSGVLTAGPSSKLLGPYRPSASPGRVPS